MLYFYLDMWSRKSTDLWASKFASCEVQLLEDLVSEECEEGGKLTYSWLVNLYEDMFPFGRVEAYTKLVFRALDRENKGFLSTGDIVCFLSTLTVGEPRDRAELMFRILDINRQGKVGRDEIKQVRKKNS